MLTTDTYMQKTIKFVNFLGWHHDFFDEPPRGCRLHHRRDEFRNIAHADTRSGDIEVVALAEMKVPASVA